jgi:hypothetical protein
MARRGSEIPTEVGLVPIDAVAAHVGYLPEVIWRRLDPADVHLNWAYVHCVTPGRARELVDGFRADAERAEEITRQRNAEHERKLEAENEKLRREAAAARPPTGERTLHGVRTFSPGDGPAPEWMGGDDE